jgi:hypothetical protein
MVMSRFTQHKDTSLELLFKTNNSQQRFGSSSIPLQKFQNTTLKLAIFSPPADHSTSFNHISLDILNLRSWSYIQGAGSLLRTFMCSLTQDMARHLLSSLQSLQGPIIVPILCQTNPQIIILYILIFHFRQEVGS